ncbi:GNAT family N-acetyltransferase [Streptomyces sp. NPDC002920]
MEIAREASHELVGAFGRLLPQLSSTAEPLDYEAVDRLVTCDANTVLIAGASERIVGTLTLVLLPLPSGLRARIEDVVVDDDARGQVFGGFLIQQALGGFQARDSRSTASRSRSRPTVRGRARAGE